MRHDDFHLYCPRKRNRYDGSIAGISRTSAMDDYMVTILLLSVYVLHVPVAGSLFFVGFALMDLHRSISAVGIIGFHYRPYPSGSHAVFEEWY